MRLRRKKNNRDESIWRLRYGSSVKYREMCAESHRKTHGLCCVCLTRKSTQIHHACYGNDIAGKSIFPVCQHCHYHICHHKANWIRCSKNPVWENRNTEEFIQKLRSGYELLVNETAPIFESKKRIRLYLQSLQIASELYLQSLQISSIRLKAVITLKEAAMISNLSTGFLNQHLKSGELQGQKLGRGWKIRPLDLQKFVDKLFCI
ncbi:MAG: helix-turn-helix domain-containing protein [Gloeotrichia echinulata GP01]